MSEVHVIELTDYEVANLREALTAAGCGQPYHQSPLNALHTGDWTCQIWAKLPEVDHWVCQTAWQMTAEAIRRGSSIGALRP